MCRTSNGKFDTFVTISGNSIGISTRSLFRCNPLPCGVVWSKNTHHLMSCRSANVNIPVSHSMLLASLTNAQDSSHGLLQRKCKYLYWRFHTFVTIPCNSIEISICLLFRCDPPPSGVVGCRGGQKQPSSRELL